MFPEGRDPTWRFDGKCCQNLRLSPYNVSWKPPIIGQLSRALKPALCAHHPTEAEPFGPP